ncbi:MAG: hypothetical protein AUK35_09715 [Zetaproteobacteria bacterium CG2_30_46_52]|nr:MAG: hypothetical protein AUK35_09715 [Zetaproteobacteria bacterium CG2_30_46_52]
MNSVPHWTTYLAALLTPTIAILGSFIAYRQWKLAQNRLKLELFDRRFSIYSATQSLLSSIMRDGKARDDEVYNFLTATREAKWLLSFSVADYLEKELYHKAIDLQTLSFELKDLPAGIERTKNIHTQADIKKWFFAQYAVVDEKFNVYLKLSH